MSHNVTLIYGDGIGPEVVGATRKIIDATGVDINWEVCEAGAEVFKKGLATGIPQETIESIQRNKLALKGPLETPIGFGEKSANVTLRKLFETYGNIRPVREMPGVPTPFQGRNIDIAIVRENVEDLYAGIEYMQTPSVAECLKLISRKGCEKIARLAFEYARAQNRKLVHCATKANIMKLTEGLMKRTFEEVAEDYPDIESQHIIVDNCAHMLVKQPENFDVIVTTNMNGDILSDLSSALIGGLGFASGANLGDDIAIFEAVHGSAPKYAGKNVINPTAVLLSGVMMLRYLNEFEAAEKIEQALFHTMAVDKKLTRDVIGDEGSVKTTEFTDAIISNPGKDYEGENKRNYQPLHMPDTSDIKARVEPKNRSVAGVDVFIEANTEVQDLGQSIEALCEGTPFKLKVISSRGVKVYPMGDVQPEVGDFFCCRLIGKDEAANIDDRTIASISSKIAEKHRWMHVEKLNIFDDTNAFSKTHGED